MKKGSILVNREAYFFLSGESRKQRGCKPLTAEQKSRIWKRVTYVSGGDFAELTKDSFGGGDGTYNGRWWGWSLETLKDMLGKAGFDYKEGREIEYTYAY